MNIDLDVEGFNTLQTTFDKLEHDWGESDAVWVVGTDREYGEILEFGRGPITPNEKEALAFEIDGEEVVVKSVEGHQPYPWFRPAVREFQANPREFIRDNTDFSSLQDIDSADEFVQTVAFALKNQMTDNVSADTAIDRSPGTHPDHPSRDTGTLANSIQAVRVK